jgi:hypothetical protein
MPPLAPPPDPGLHAHAPRPTIGRGWSPERLTTSPGALAIFEFDPNNPRAIIATPAGTVLGVVNSLDPTQSLATVSAVGGNPVRVAERSGADRARRVLRFGASAIDSNLRDPSTNWLDAGGVNGPAGAALVDLPNSLDLGRNGSFTTILALEVENNASYEAGPIWGSPRFPLQYVQLRINRSSGKQGANLADGTGRGGNAEGAVTPGWHVMTMIKHRAMLAYRLDGTLIQTTALQSHAGFIASDFMIGGGFPQGPHAHPDRKNGVPPPAIGEFQAYTGVLAGTDLIHAEALAARSIGLSLAPAASRPGGTARPGS